MPEDKLISHIKDAHGHIHATLVATSSENIGISVRNPGDRCSKAVGVQIAYERAISGDIPVIPKRKLLAGIVGGGYWKYSTLLSLVDEEYFHLRARAEKYFKRAD